MMRVLAIAAVLIGLAGPAAADFDAGVAAYSLGDFDAARAAFEPLAETDSRALFYLGRMYYRGEGVAADEARAIALYERAAAAGEPAAMAALAAAYEARGDADLAFDWMTMAAEAGLPFAQAELGLAYETGDRVTQSRRDAIIWYGRAARGGSAVGALRLYRLDTDGDRDKHGGLDEVQRRLDQAFAGDSEARFRLGLLFTDVGAHAQAFDWFRLAAAQGHHDAEYELGYSYLTGRGVKRSETGGVVWIRRAIGGGHAVAMFQLGNIYRFGLGGINVHEGLALEWYENAVEDGYSRATHAVVEMYIARAKDAAKIGNAKAAGEEIIAAVAWYERGVRLGDAEVAFAYARNLDEGFGGLTTEDDTSAYVFYAIAVQQGSAAAAAARDRLAGQLSDAEIARAAARIAAWLAENAAK